MAGRNCGKCRLHGKIVPLKGHRRACPFSNCSCSRCSTHDQVLAMRYQERQDKSDKGKQWRASLASSLKTETPVTPSSTAVSFPDMKPTLHAPNVEECMSALQVANFESSKTMVLKKMPKVDQKRDKQKKQLQEHRNIYKSINSYSHEIAETAKDLSPLAVLKTAILLHQRQPRQSSDAGKETNLFSVTTSAPAVQASPESSTSLHFKFHDQLDKLKQVLPFASEVKLASLLTTEQGDMNAVVQKILESDSRAGDDESCVDTKVIDLTDENPTPSLTDVNVDTSMLKDILDTVKRNESLSQSEKSSPGCSNLLSFHKPHNRVATTSSLVGEADKTSQQLSERTSSNRQRDCPYCFQENQQGNFCSHCGGVFDPTFYRW